MENEEWPTGGVFDDDDVEGVFEDEESIFDDEGPVDHANPVTTRAQEARVSALPGTPAPAPARQLVAVFGADGQPQVAYTVDGQPQEQFRPPTPQELTLLQQRGRLVKGTIEQPQTLGAVSPGGSFLTRNATLLGGLAAVAVGAGVYFYQKKKKERDQSIEEVDLLSGDLLDSSDAEEIDLIPDEVEY